LKVDVEGKKNGDDEDEDEDPVNEFSRLDYLRINDAEVEQEVAGDEDDVFPLN
jgi:hypothetical protein